MIRVTIWNENIHDREDDRVKELYPEGLHGAIRDLLKCDEEITVTTTTLDAAEHGMPDELLNKTDVLIWWGHCAHAEVKDELVDRIQKRVLAGMGLIVLHSGHISKIFRRMMGTACRLRWREVGEKERLWVVSPSHPIAQGIPETFVIPNHEMYGEPFDIPQDGRIVYLVPAIFPAQRVAAED